MIKTILDWIFGKKDSEVKTAEAPAPYKTEASVAEAPAPVVEVAAPVVETATVTVRAKYKRVDLTKMTKAELLVLVAKHSLEIKSRATKEELVKALIKV